MTDDLDAAVERLRKHKEVMPYVWLSPYVMGGKTEFNEWSAINTVYQSQDEALLAAAYLRERDETPVNIDDLSELPGAIRRIGHGEDEVAFGNVFIDQYGTITICNGKIGKATMGQLRRVCELLGIPLTEPADAR